jgi:hypothetical protein
MKKQEKEDIRKVIDYAIFLAAKKGFSIPKDSYGEIEWVRVGKSKRAKSVTFNIPHLVKVDLPNWDFVQKQPQRQLL